MNRNHVMVAALATLFASFIGCGDEKAPLGTPCFDGSECASGLCEQVDLETVCTEPCTAGQPCPSALDSMTLTCREFGYCGPHCSFSGIVEDFLCDAESGAVRACADGNDVNDCAACGCSFYGGGVCIATMGCIDPIATGMPCPEDRACQSGLCDPNTDVCVVPAAPGSTCADDRYCASDLCHPTSNTCVVPADDGEPCTADRFCTSELCDPVADECVAPLPLGSDCSANRFCESGHCSEHMGCYEPGEPGDTCYEDGECISDHCSTDGDTSEAGECLLAIGEPCASFGVEPHCDRCVMGLVLRRCQREFCHATRAPCGEGFACRQNTGGTNTCFERCGPSYNDLECSDFLATCLSDGVCSR